MSPIPGFGEPEHREQHARLVRAWPSAGAVDVQRAKRPQVTIEVIRHGGKKGKRDLESGQMLDAGSLRRRNAACDQYAWGVSWSQE